MLLGVGFYIYRETACSLMSLLLLLRVVYPLRVTPEGTGTKIIKFLVDLGNIFDRHVILESPIAKSHIVNP